LKSIARSEVHKVDYIPSKAAAVLLFLSHSLTNNEHGAPKRAPDCALTPSWSPPVAPSASARCPPARAPSSRARGGSCAAHLQAGRGGSGRGSSRQWAVRCGEEKQDKAGCHRLVGTVSSPQCATTFIAFIQLPPLRTVCKVDAACELVQQPPVRHDRDGALGPRRQPVVQLADPRVEHLCEGGAGEGARCVGARQGGGGVGFGWAGGLPPGHTGVARGHTSAQAPPSEKLFTRRSHLSCAVTHPRNRLGGWCSCTPGCLPRVASSRSSHHTTPSRTSPPHSPPTFWLHLDCRGEEVPVASPPPYLRDCIKVEPARGGHEGRVGQQVVGPCPHS